MTDVAISSQDFWFKVVGMLQQNWALIEHTPSTDEVTVYFIGDTSGVFDQLAFATEAEAREALRRNGFERLEESPESKRFLTPPSAPFHHRPHPNGPIYSSGRFWR